MTLKIIIDQHESVLEAAREYVRYRKSWKKKHGYDLEKLPMLPGKGYTHSQCDNCADPLWVADNDRYNYCGDCRPKKQERSRRMGFEP